MSMQETSYLSAPDSDDKPHSNLSEHPLYDEVLTMLLWDEPKDKVYHRMSVNQVPADIADLLYGHAKKERIALIRSENMSKIMIGVGALLLGIVVFCALWFGLGIIPRIVVGLCFLAGVFGVWRLADGIFGYLSAPQKKGSVVDS